MIENFGAWHNLPFCDRRPTASAAPTSSSRSTTRRASGTSRCWPTGTRTRSSSTAAARASRTRYSPPASAPMIMASAGSAGGFAAAMKDMQFGIAMMPYYRRRHGQAAELDHRRRHACGCCRASPRTSTRASPSSSPSCRARVCRSKWHRRRATCRSPRPPIEHTRAAGLLRKIPRPRRRGGAAQSQPADRELQGSAHRQFRADPRRRWTRSSKRCGPARRTPKPRSTRR